MAVSALLHPTTQVFPATQTVLQASRFPLGVFVQPLREGVTLPVVSYGLHDVVRCQSCGGYLSPFVVWVAAGRAWMCPLCKAKNAVSDEFYHPLNDEGRRRDESQRADLTSLDFDISAPESFIDRPPLPPTLCFVLDCSLMAKRSGLLDAFCDTVAEVVREEALPGLPRTQVAVILFTSEVHLVSFTSDRIQLFSLNKATETVFLPVPLEEVLVSAADYSRAICKALELAKALANREEADNSALRMALMFAHGVLQHCGGRVMVAVSDFDNSAYWKQEGKDGYLHSFDTWYLSISKEFRSLNISIDLFLSASRFSDLQSLGHLPESSNGQFFFYPNLTPAQRDKVEAEVYLAVTRGTMWDASIRLRISTDWKVVQAYGSFHVRAGDLFSVPGFDQSQAILYRIELDDAVAKQGRLYLQAAVLYTTDDGERRIRVCNASLKVSSDLTEVLSSGSQEAVAAMWAKQAVVHSIETSNFACGKVYLEHQLKGLYAAVGSQSLPENLAFLPYYCFGLTKLPLFSPSKAMVKGGLALGTDQAAFIRYAIVVSPPAFVCQLAYPRLYALRRVVETQGEEAQPLNLSIKSLSPDGVFCLDTSLELFIWVGTKHTGPESPAELRTSVFGNASVFTESHLSECSTPEAERVKELIARVRCVFGRYQTLQVFAPGTASELQYFPLRFFARLIEDTPSPAPSFLEFNSRLSL